ncbi:MAG: DUF1501 domain-containing protein [Fuerstiella sp.]|nr:DUF1501 domain-containing protein [Fuerstiella sp.]
MSTTGSSLPHPRIARREIIQSGAIGLLGLTTQNVISSRAVADMEMTLPAKKVVYIFLPGGPPQHETFDPKPMATAEVRGEFNAIETAVPGMLFCEHLPLLAQQADKIALLRSVHHHSNDHIAGTTIMTSGDTRVPALTPETKEPDTSDAPGIVSLAGYFRPGAEQLPGSAVLPEYVGRGSGTGQTVPGQQGGRMGRQHDPWLVQAASRCLGWGPCPNCFDDGDDDAAFAFGLQHNHTAPGPVFAATSLNVPQGADRIRLDHRLSLLHSLERRRFQPVVGPDAQAHDSFQARAASMVTSSRVQKALNGFTEQDDVQDQYGRNKFGWSLLLTRHLLEAGVNMIQVSLGRNGTWDLHRRAFPLLKESLLPPMDLAVSSFLEDLQQRGLLDETLVVMCGEFGRTPRVSSPQPGRRPGRDHWGALQTILFAGGGVTGGNIVGSSDRIGGYPHECPKTPGDVAATIFDALGIPQDSTYHDITGRPHPVYLGSPVTELYM